MTSTTLGGLITREQRLSALINTVLSAVFFLAVFGVRPRLLTMGAPDGFAFDFLAQGGAIAFMATLVPTLVLRAKLLRGDLASDTSVPTPVQIVKAIVAMVLAGLASAAVLGGIFLWGVSVPLGWWTALAVKLVYGAALGFAVTRIALNRQFSTKRDSEGKGETA